MNERAKNVVRIAGLWISIAYLLNWVACCFEIATHLPHKVASVAANAFFYLSPIGAALVIGAIPIERRMQLTTRFGKTRRILLGAGLISTILCVFFLLAILSLRGRAIG